MLNNTEKALDKFGKGVIKQARTNLTRNKKNVSKTLYNKLVYDLAVNPNSFSLSFKMPDYGAYQDEGVKGADPSLVKNGVQKAPNSRFAYRNERPPIKPVQEWLKNRGIRFRDEKGRFKKGGTKTLAFLISRRIYAEGIKPSRFFSRAFETQFRRLPKEITKAYALDLENFLKFTKK